MPPLVAAQRLSKAFGARNLFTGLSFGIEPGERIGLIKFGSRVDVDFGPEWEVTVREGERVSAGSSIVARRKEA